MISDIMLRRLKRSSWVVASICGLVSMCIAANSVGWDTPEGYVPITLFIWLAVFCSLRFWTWWSSGGFYRYDESVVPAEPSPDFKWEFENSSERKFDAEKIANCACRLVLNFLKKSPSYKLTKFTFTELFSFIFIEFDLAFFSRNRPEREDLSRALFKSHSQGIKMFGLGRDSLQNEDVMNSRITEYGAMLRKGSDKAGEVKKLHFYLIQASGRDSFFSEGDPVVLGDAIVEFDQMVELTVFYSDEVAPLVMSTL